MDDVKIICSDKYQARRALKDLSLLLRKLRLTLNSKKTEICPCSDKEKLQLTLDEGSAEIQHLHAMWNTRSREVIRRSIPILKSVTLRLITEGAVHKREFRFCLRRLEFLALCSDFAVPDEFFSDVTPAIIAAIAEYPASTDQFVRYLAAVPVPSTSMDLIADFLADDHRAIYTWQNYHVWSLLAYKGHLNNRLMLRAAEILRRADDANRAGATIYIGALGGDELRIQAAKQFRSLNTFIGQRTALIAVHQLNFKPVVDTYVRPHVRRDLRGAYRKLRERPGVYFEPEEPMSITNFVDLDRGYE